MAIPVRDRTLFCTVCLVTALGTAANAQTGTVWKPDPKLLAKLAAPAPVGGYTLRPPKGYSVQSQDGPGGSKAVAWTGAVRPDGTRSMLMLIVAPIPPAERGKRTLDQVAQVFLDRVKGRRTGFRQGPSQAGSLGGLKFVRIDWSGTEPSLGVSVRGFQYTAIDGDRVVQLWSQDVDPASKAALPLTEAAIRTFGKAG